jgi:hypothetical protein
MDNSRKTGFDDRLNAAANPKKAELEKFRARSGANDPAFAERQTAGHAVVRRMPSATRPGWPELSVRPTRRLPAKPPWTPSWPPAVPISPGRPPLTRPSKPSAGPPATPPAKPVRDDDNGPPGNLAFRPAMRRSTCWPRAPENPAVRYVLQSQKPHNADCGKSARETGDGIYYLTAPILISSAFSARLCSSEIFSFVVRVRPATLGAPTIGYLLTEATLFSPRSRLGALDREGASRSYSRRQ